MQKVLAVILAIWKTLSWFAKKHDKKQKRKEKGAQNVTKGLKERDASKITAGFDDINM